MKAFTSRFRLVVPARGTGILVKHGEGEMIPYPFRSRIRQHLPAGRLPKIGKPFLHLNAIRLGQQFKQLLYKPPLPAAAAFPTPPLKQTAAAAAAAVQAVQAVQAAHAPTASKVPPPNAGAVPATPRNAKQQHKTSLQHVQEGEAATVRAHQPPPLAPAPSSPSSRSSSKSSSTRAEHGRSCEERTSSKHRPRQPSLSTQGSTGNQSDMVPSQE
eukprot:1137918-Pelagomonas_calceolata.AAC.1